MAKFGKKSKTTQEIPTAALPDIIFMLLFFFMVVTVMRESELLVENKLPKATQLTKLEEKSLVSFLYVGKPKNEDLGVAPRIQANDVLIGVDQVIQWVAEEKGKLGEDAGKINISLKADVETKMGIISDVKQELREANALKLNYSSVQRGDVSR